jgi:hypothetical protein
MADNNNADIQITKAGRVTAGILLVAFTLFSIIIIMAFWPDKLPKAGSDCTLYKYDWFDMTLDTCACKQTCLDTSWVEATSQDTTLPLDTTTTASDTNKASQIKKNPLPQKTAKKPATEAPTKGHINLNIILLMLVAAGGFLGNMIHIATSFTTFVGAGKFQRSWVLWYWVRPFTASALALALYFAFGATSDPANVDLDRILTLAILSGLFTDIATQKLKEVFDVLFSPKDNRPNKLTDPVAKIATITPEELAKEGENTIVLKGTNLKSQKLTIKIDGKAITETKIADKEISFKYTIPAEAKSKTELVLEITDPEGNTVSKKTLPVKDKPAPPPEEGT